MRPFLRLAALAGIAFAAGCGGGGGAVTPSATAPPGSAPSPSATASPSPSPSPDVGPGVALGDPQSGPNGYWGPAAVANALQLPVQSGWDGRGETIGIIMDDPANLADVQTFLAYYGIVRSGTITVKQIDGGTTTQNSHEAYLDLETISSLAPGATVVFYEIPSLSSTYVNDALEQAVVDGANVVSYSASGCEAASDTTSAFHAILGTAVQNDIAFVASSGDEGSDCNSSGSQGVGHPASDPLAIGAGGNDTTYGTYQLTSNVVWADAGGGVSQYFGIPSYQQGLAGVASTTYRNVPDVSMPAKGASVYASDEGWFGDNGTSWSAPEFAALMAEVYEYCRQSLASPASVAYYVQQHDPAAFVDVTSGNDRYAGSASFYGAGPGYDNASGLGVPLGMPFAKTICPNHVVASAGGRFRPASFARRGAAAAFALDVTPRVASLRDLGMRDASATIRVQLVLRPTASLAADESQVVALLQRAGFTIVARFANRLVVDADAPAATVERYFATSIHDVAQDGYGVRYLAVTPVVVPAELAPYVNAVQADDVVTMHAADEP